MIKNEIKRNERFNITQTLHKHLKDNFLFTKTTKEIKRNVRRQ